MPHDGPLGAAGVTVAAVALIAAERRATLFEAFRRGDAHGQEGVGLGLAIASQAARLLGAELGVESVVGAGSTFSLALPASPPTEQEPGERPASEHPNEPKGG